MNREPSPLGGADVPSVAKSVLARLTAAERSPEDLRRTIEQFCAAIDVLDQGFCLFDEAERLVAANQCYFAAHDDLVEEVFCAKETDWPCDMNQSSKGTTTAVGGKLYLEAAIPAEASGSGALGVSDAMLNSFLNHLPFDMALKDKEGRYLLVNRRYEEIFGKGVETVRGKLPHEVHDRTDYGILARDQDLRVLRSREVLEEEEVYHQDDGEHVILTTKFPIFGERGEVAGLGGMAVDITERKRGEEALKASREQLANIAENLPGVVYQRILPPGGKFIYTYISPGLSDLIGECPHEGMSPGDWFEDNVHPEDQAIVDRVEAEAQEYLHGYDLDYRVIKPDGEIKWLRAISSTNRRADGTIVYDGVVLDIGAQKRAEEALREAQAALENRVRERTEELEKANADLTAEIAERRKTQVALREREHLLSEAQRIGHIGHWMVNVGSGTIEMSDEMYRIYGVDRKKFSGSLRTRDRLIHPEDRESAVARRERAVAEKIPYDADCRIVRPDQEVRYISNKGYPELNARGQVVSIFGVTQDVTQQKMAEAALRESEARNRAIVEALDRAEVGLCLYKIGRGPDFVNSTLAAMTGAGVGDNQSGLGPSAIPTAIVDGLCQAEGTILSAIDQLGHWSGELTWVRPDLDPVVVDCRTAGYPDDHLIHIITDITERKADEKRHAELEEGMREAQKMEAIGQLAGGTAHDINNLLQPILTFTKITQDQIDDPVLQGYLNSVLECARKAALIVTDVLTFARKTGGELELVDVMELAHRSLRFANDVVPPSTVIQSVIDQSAAFARINETEFIQMVINLIKNASDAMDGRGEIRMQVDPIRLSLQQGETMSLPPGDYVRLSVSDTGPGIAPEITKRIFDPFFTTKEVGRGTGLGLSVVFGIIKSWRGGIAVNSRPAEGACFEVFIPVVDARGSEVGETLHG